MNEEQDMFLSSEMLPETADSLVFNILSGQEEATRGVRGNELEIKKELEGKITVNPDGCHIFALPPAIGVTQSEVMEADRSRWDFYCILVPFTLHPAPGGNHYHEVSFFIRLVTPEAIAFDLFPKRITTSKEGVQVTILPAQCRIQELNTGTDSLGASRCIHFPVLRPTITASGEGDSTFYWTYQGSKMHKEIPFGTHYALYILRVPRGTEFVDGAMHYQVIIAKKFLSGWRYVDSGASPQSVRWQLRDAPAFLRVAPAREATPATPRHNLQCDVCIVCALAEEATAFMDAAQVPFETHISKRNEGVVYYAATIHNDIHEELRLLVSCPPRPGPQEMTMHLAALLDEFQPRFVGMTGICAGDRRRVKLGDLVVAERAFFYDNGKFEIGENGQPEYLHDTLPYYPPSNILQLVGGFSAWQEAVKTLTRPPSKRQQREWLLNRLLHTEGLCVNDIPLQERQQKAPGWRHIVQELQPVYLTENWRLLDKARVLALCYGPEEFPFQDPQKPARHIKPLASGSAVRADDPFLLVRKPVRGTVAIDMEGAAFYRVMADRAGISSLVVKSVCDYADSDKDDSYHVYASAASALYMLAFIKKYVTTAYLPRLPLEL